MEDTKKLIEEARASHHHGPAIVYLLADALEREVAAREQDRRTHQMHAEDEELLARGSDAAIQMHIQNQADLEKERDEVRRDLADRQLTVETLQRQVLEISQMHRDEVAERATIAAVLEARSEAHMSLIEEMTKAQAKCAQMRMEIERGIGHAEREHDDNERAGQHRGCKLACVLAAALRELTELQPMEAAPRDGSQFLALADGIQIIVWWGIPAGGRAEWRWARGPAGSPMHPLTGWLPLPPIRKGEG